ncbi:uncharacterized protein LOC143618396 [Bidens hawaiensis]|uniref:uncharacterized protein LOC143618396 n=1 Tax=Bidens hawaiensis TaxID=980011 RepID=UPI00404A78E9
MSDLSWLNPLYQFQNQLESNCRSIPDGLLHLLWSYMYREEMQSRFSKPMVWIGIYIAVASLFCILPMLADLLHGFRNKKLWFPCKYFTLNAASLTVIAVAMKLPMDLNNSMPLAVDLAAKLGSMPFMCAMMANLLPSLATMDSKELLANIIALAILVVTLVVNVCIQLETSVIAHGDGEYLSIATFYSWLIARFYVAMLLLLLVIHVCSALMILKSKQILFSKYKEGHETALKDLELQQPTVEKLNQHVSKYWIMAGTGSPQFMAVCSTTSSASGVICVSTTILHVIIMHYTRPYMKFYRSDYKWSVIVILITQFTGSILGTVAPLSRCFASLSFKVSIKWIWNQIRIFKVESYYTQKLSDWKRSSVPMKLSSRRCKIVIQDLKVLILSLCVGFQTMVVVACKLTALIPIFIVIGVLCCLQCWKWLKDMFGVSYNVSVKTPTQLQHIKDRNRYVLQLEDDIELAERTLEGILKSVNHVIQRAETQQPKNLMKLLEKSNCYEGVGKHDFHQVPPLTKEKYVDCWSLPVVTLTTIAVCLPNIQKHMIDGLLMSVSEGLRYVKHVEETLNARNEYAIIQKAAEMLWVEVEIYHIWLGNKMPNPTHQFNTPKEIVQWFSDTAKNMVTEVESKNMKGSLYTSVSANSMYRIAKTILLSHHDDIDQVSQEELFVQLSSVISQILAACLTNLPQVIAMKCHTSVIEKMDESVHTAAQVLGETMQIINSLQDRELPSLNPNELPFIDKWRDFFLHPSP